MNIMRFFRRKPEADTTSAVATAERRTPNRAGRKRGQKQRVFQSDWPVIVERAKNGDKVADIAATYGVTPGRIWQILNNHGVKTRVTPGVYNQRLYDRCKCGGRKTKNAATCTDCYADRLRKWTPETVIASVKAWSDRHDGAIPTRAEWERDRQRGANLPSLPTVHRLAGAWSDVLSKAGLADDQ